MELSVRERPLRVCVVGCGAVGSLFAANLGTLADVEVCRLRPRRATTSRRSTATGSG